MINFIALMLLLSNMLDVENENNIKAYIQSKYEINIEDVFKVHEITEAEKVFVAHAAGIIDNKYTYLNCLEAIESTYNEGCILIEMDVEYTSDGVPVMLHSWDGFINSFFGVESGRVYSYNQFKNFEMINGWHQLSLEDVIGYMDTRFKNMYLITDTKNDNKKLLKLISENYTYMKNRIIPQVYNQDEYEYAKSLGFENVIYTLYLSDDTREEIIEFCKENDPFAITMSTSWAYTDLPLELEKLGTFTYAHTINKEDEYELLRQNGIKGVYTDVLFNKIKINEIK